MAKNKDVSEKEIELWIEHIGPVWKKDLVQMKITLVNWYSAMQVAGLAPEGDNGMELFINHDIW